jgi:phage tail-like protein
MPETQTKSERATPPFNTFRFVVEIRVSGVSDSNICAAAFSEVDGMDMTIEPKTIREGGNNNSPVHMVGQLSYGQLTLKRGMTPNFDLWKWFARVSSPGYRGVRADATVVIYSTDGATEEAVFVLERCMPTKLKVPGLNARDGALAIEEMQLLYESLRLDGPDSGETVS